MKGYFQKERRESQATASSNDIAWDIAHGANKIVGIIVMMACAYKWTTYLATLHENHLWFSEIKVINDTFHVQLEAASQQSNFKLGTGSGTGDFLPHGAGPLLLLLQAPRLCPLTVGGNRGTQAR